MYGGEFEDDPAADFLERERKELAGLEDDASADFFERERNDLASVENDETWNNLQNDDANAGKMIVRYDCTNCTNDCTN